MNHPHVVEAPLLPQVTRTLILYIYFHTAFVMCIIHKLMCSNKMTMTMTMKISLFDINHLNTMIRESKAEKNNVVNEQETIQNNIKCRYRRPTP